MIEEVIVNFSLQKYCEMAQNLLTCEKLVLGLRLGAVGLSAIYYGACQYITSVEVPAR